MALLQCFESSALPYITRSDVPIQQFLSHYYGPNTAGASSAAVWSTYNYGTCKFGGKSIIHVFAPMADNTSHWAHSGSPGYSYGHWILDPLSGSILMKRLYVASDGTILLYERGSAVPGLADPGRLYRWDSGGTAVNYAAHPVRLSTANDGDLDTIWGAGGVILDQFHARTSPAFAENPVHPNPTSGYFLPSDFGFTSGINDFAIDAGDDATSWGNDRIWMRDNSSTNIGRVVMRKRSDYSFVAYLYTPNRTRHIVPTGDGFVFVIDMYDWICLYDYNGVFHGAMRNPYVTTPPGGSSYGWDHVYRRLLRVDLTANDGSGFSTVTVKGFLPLPQATMLSAPIPRSVPRKNVLSYFFCHLHGDGGEPITGRVGRLAPSVALGVTNDTKISDADGDFVMPMAPVSTGANTMELTV